VDAAACQPDRVERHCGSDHGSGSGGVVDCEQREDEPARERKRRQRRPPAHGQGCCRGQGERERERPRVRVMGGKDADGADHARNDGNGRIEQELMTAAHTPNLAPHGVARVLPQE
jgi:hypothetical protein